MLKKNYADALISLLKPQKQRMHIKVTTTTALLVHIFP
jgi:hypothetical protein